ncbi:MAG: TetR/AcrR family transcriptional regulator [Myxococcota bacterium]
MSKKDESDQTDEPAWREQAVSRRLVRARARAEERVQRFLDAALALLEDKSSTEFTIQEVVERSGQSLRSFYQYFDGKDELLFALFEESVREATDDIAAAVDAESEPIARLRAFTIRLHEWCAPDDSAAQRGRFNRVPITDFSWNLGMKNPERVGSVMFPLSRKLVRLIDEAQEAGLIQVESTSKTASLIQQTVMHSWLFSRVADDPRMQVSAEETWAFCLQGLEGGTKG